MDRQPTQQESFIVRIWREQDPPGWRGWVQHTRSGESAVVRSLDDLVAFFESRTGKLNERERQGLR